MNPAKEAGASLDALVTAFNSRIAELQELVVARNMYAPTSVPDLASVDTTLTAMESQIDVIRHRLYEERRAIPKAKKLIEQSEKQKKRLEHMLTHVPLGMQESMGQTDPYPSRNFDDGLDYISTPGMSNLYLQASESSRIKEDPTAPPKFEKRGKGPAPRWYVSAEELDSVAPYMRQRLTLEKINIAINEVATYADTNAHLISCSTKKIADDMWEKVLELRDVAARIKGKHFFLESDIKGPGLKFDNTGKAIITVLRHLGRIQDTRVGSHRVLVLKPQVH